jgi:drug/metabolite transporter (DMT)-like permease
MPASDLLRRHRVTLLTAFVVLANVVGNLALSWGMKHPLGWRPLQIAAIDDLLNPYVLLGILLLAAWTLSRITLLSWADLSYVLPVCSIGYVINALIGYFLLHEQISPTRWLGTALILGGTILTGLTPPKSGQS